MATSKLQRKVAAPLKGAVTFTVASTIAFALTLAACSTPRTRPDAAPGTEGGVQASPSPGASFSPTPGSSSLSEEYGPPVPAGPPAPPAGPEYGPTPYQLRPIVLVLGPGMARGFAHAGVLRALQEAKIPIGAIVGSEMGALVGGLYALSDGIGSFEWKLQRLRPDMLPRQRTRFAFFSSPGKELSKGLQEIVGNKDVSAAHIPLRVVLNRQGDHGVIAVDKGSAAVALRAAAATDGWIDAGEWEGAPATAALLSRPYPVSEARALGIGPVVVIDVLSDATAQTIPPGKSPEEQELVARMAQARRTAASDLKEADLVIEPILKDIGYLDYTQRTEVAFRGKKAINLKLAEIKRWVGLPNEPAATEPAAPTPAAEAR